MLTTINRNDIVKTGLIPNGLTLIESVQPLVIKESQEVEQDGKKVLRVTGIFQEADKKNENGRIYPHPILNEAVLNLQEPIKIRSVMGELDHPADAKINLDRVSHLVTKLWCEGKTVYGQAEVLEDLPCGQIFGALLRAKVTVGVSSRGVGELRTVSEGWQNESYQEVCPGYTIVTWDAVANPSVVSAVVHIMESKRLTSPKKSRNYIMDYTVAKLAEHFGNKIQL